MDGILIIDKPAGLTSHDVVARLRRILKTKKIGHTGTLDPFATGVLVMLIGKATRLAQFLARDEKEYEALVRFGFETDTGDRTGSRKAASPESQVPSPKSQVEEISIENVDAVLEQFRREISQVPPMYSAKKIDGKKLYELARKGIEVERKAVTVTISKLEVFENEGKEAFKERTTPALARHPSFDQGGEPGDANSPLAAHDAQLPTWDLGLRVACSAGTYIRTLAEDIGRAAGSAAHLAELRRTRAGRFDLSRAVTLEELEKLETPAEILVPMNEAVSHLPEMALNADDIARVRNGIKIPARSALPDLQTVRLTGAEDELIAIALHQDGIIHPRLVI